MEDRTVERQQVKLIARLRYAWAWVIYAVTIGFWLALAGGALWYGYQRGGWPGVGVALALIWLASMLASEEGRDQLSIGIGYVLGFAFLAAVTVGGLIGIGYLLGIGMQLAN